jgi:hypothetical protein
MDTDEFFGLSQRKFTPDEMSQIAKGVADGVATWTRSSAFDNAMKRLDGRIGLLATTDRASVMAYDGPVVAGRSEQ